MKTDAEKIEVMQAFLRGQEIQVMSLEGLSDAEWHNHPAPVWSWGICDYRIKPREPRVIWVNEYYGQDDVVHDNEESAIRGAARNSYAPKRTAVKYIEVIE